MYAGSLRFGEANYQKASFKSVIVKMVFKKSDSPIPLLSWTYDIISNKRPCTETSSMNLFILKTGAYLLI